MSDLKFCQADNIEQQFWKILYYHFIETLRKSITQANAQDKTEIVKLINVIIEEGNAFFENVIQLLEKTYKFSTEDYLNDNNALPPKGLGYVGLAMVSVQKLYVFLGDLARYKEQVNETNNYLKSKIWYTKAQQVNPKNGRPYNQLAILAIYAVSTKSVHFNPFNDQAELGGPVFVLKIVFASVSFWYLNLLLLGNKILCIYRQLHRQDRLLYILYYIIFA